LETDINLLIIIYRFRSIWSYLGNYDS